MLGHCGKQEPTVHSPFFREFPSDSIPKVTKDVNVHFLIHSFAFRDKLIMDKALEKKIIIIIQHNLPVTPINSKFLALR